MDCSEKEVPPQYWNGKNGDVEPDGAINLSLKNFCWRYRGEGNANLVISLPREKVIIRIQKCEYDAILDPTTIREWEIKLKKSVVFYKKVMVPLLGTEFILPPELAKVSDDEISDMDRALFKIRPSFRLSKGIRLGLVTVQPDYTLLPPRECYKSLLNNHNTSYRPQNEEFNTFCVEIKPKQGWVPPGDRQHPKCAFCLKQYLKLQKKRAAFRSKYCPLDLFSGDKARMMRALQGLLDTPQNNLKIFHNGNILYGEGTNIEINEVLDMFFDAKNKSQGKNMVDRLCHLILGALTREFDNSDGVSPSILYPEPKSVNFSYPGDQKRILTPSSSSISLSFQNGDSHCDWSHSPLPPKCILQRVLSVQKLQKTGFKSVHSQFKEQSELRGNYSYVDELFTLDNQLDDIQRYLLSATAKDCSIFVAFQKTVNPDDNSSFVIRDSEGVTYRLNIGISDIDPKPLSCIGKHYKRDEEVLAASLQSEN